MARHFTKKVLEAYNRTYVQPSDFKRLNLTYSRVPNKHVGNLILLLTFFPSYTFHLICNNKTRLKCKSCACVKIVVKKRLNYYVKEFFKS